MSENKLQSFDELVDNMYIYSQVKKISETNDYTKIEELMMSEKYSYISKEKKEEIILSAALAPISLQKLTGGLTQSEWDLIHYLVFEYQIDENIYSQMASDHKDQMTDNMFQKRKLNSELTTKFANSNNSSKKPKV